MKLAHSTVPKPVTSLQSQWRKSHFQQFYYSKSKRASLLGKIENLTTLIVVAQYEQFS